MIWCWTYLGQTSLEIVWCGNQYGLGKRGDFLGFQEPSEARLVPQFSQHQWGPTSVPATHPAEAPGGPSGPPAVSAFMPPPDPDHSLLEAGICHQRSCPHSNLGSSTFQPVSSLLLVPGTGPSLDERH